MPKDERPGVLDELQKRLRVALQRARRDSQRRGNVALRRNVVFTPNVGQEGTTEHAAAVQVAPVRQKGREIQDREV